MSYCELVEGEFSEFRWQVVTRWMWLRTHEVV